MSTRIADTYAIINIADLGNIDFSQVGETDENTIRKSLDETQKSLDKLQQLTIPTTEEVIKLLRDSENYHKINDYTESRK